jgi:NADH-quinone oxidoreductase subunit N
MNATLRLVDLASLSPLLILLFGALLLILLESFAEQAARKYAFTLTVATILFAFAAAIYAPASQNALLTPWLRYDPLARFFSLFFLGIGLASTLLSSAFFQRFQASHSEYFFLLLSALFGLILIGSAADFLTLFLGLETLSVALYVLCAYMKQWEISREGAMKYFFMGALAAAFLLYGIALIYGAIGSTQLSGLLEAYHRLATHSDKMLFWGGVIFLTVGLASKAAVVPFHVWAPDVYEGASTPVTAFLSVGSKAGAFAALALIFLQTLPQFDIRWNMAVAFLAFPTLIYANLVALRQTQLRRFFAYSGISHSGFLLLPLAVGTEEALPALLFYLVVYAFATLGCFAVLALLDKRSGGVALHDLQGLFRSAPLQAGVLTFCLMTLAGLPPTVGFFAKFYVFKIAFEAGYYALVIVALLTTILSAIYYLRIVAILFSESAAEAKVEAFAPLRSFPATAVGLVSLIAMLFLSFIPEPLLAWLAFAPK